MKPVSNPVEAPKDAEPPMTTVPERQSVSRPPSARERHSDRIFRVLTHCFAWFTVLVVAYIVVTITLQAWPAMREYGVGFVTGETWDPNTGEYGIRPEIWGTLYSSLLALLLGTLFGVSIALFLSEGLLAGFVFRVLALFRVQFHPFWGSLPDKLEGLLNNLVQLLAAIPSVVYGLWGIFVLIPLIRPACNAIHEAVGDWIPLFGTPLSGPGLLPAALVLAVMILPTIAAISRDALVAVPPKLREAAYGLGATRWETILSVLLPTASSGIFGSIILGFGRALGETMALAMLVGGQHTLSWSLFSPADTLAALLANHFPMAQQAEIPRLMYAALVLLVITLLVNVVGVLILRRGQARFEGGR
jgi:phosphate transport system permease protein